MASFPGLAALGRGVVLLPGQDVPAACAGWPVVTVDEAALAAPRATADELHERWLRRRPVVVRLAVDAEALRQPEPCDDPPWRLDASFELSRERLQFLVWSNNWDLRNGEPIWWHARRAARLGATPAGPADVLLPGHAAGATTTPAIPAWCDGGPRQPLRLGDGAAIVHRESIEAGSLAPGTDRPPNADLAPDQLAAVAHDVGPARIIAPAGSGKTRVLTERLRHLLVDRNVTPSTVTAVAYNKRAADELVERTTGLAAHIRTLNSLGLAVLNGTGPFARPPRGPRRVVDETGVRRILESLVPFRRQQNTDPLAVYIDALSAVRLGLTDPEVVEATLPDAAGIATVFDRYRAVLADNGLADFDEQIYGAIEVLLRKPDVRAHDQRSTRHLLVDELQDLTPAHLLLLRLLSAPAYDVFGVGDDDQVIYGYAGATPEYLLDYDRYFPHAISHALVVNYRCPPAIVNASCHLLANNHRRVAKEIQARPRADDPASPDPDASDDGLLIEHRPAAQQAAAALDRIQRWSGAGLDYADMAVLTRVSSALLAVQVTLQGHAIPCSTPLGTAILGRTGIRAALAYLRIAAQPDHIARTDIAETIRRPSRRIARNVVEMVQRRPFTSLAELRRRARSLTGADADRLAEYADDIESVVTAVAGGGTAGGLRAIRLTVGLGRLMDVLDGSRREVDRSTHGDDLAALEQVAALHPEAQDFEPWLREVLARPGSVEGVTLSTVHRVKGREWDRVIVLGADEQSFPHRLASDVEEERRIFHVAVTRARCQAVILADEAAPSPFCAELLGGKPARPATDRRHSRLIVNGRAAGRTGRVGRPAARPTAAAPSDTPAALALRAWRRETAARDQVPAYVVFSDAHLDAIAAARPTSLVQLAQCRGVGPAKLDRYGDEVLAVLDQALHDPK